MRYGTKVQTGYFRVCMVLYRCRERGGGRKPHLRARFLGMVGLRGLDRQFGGADVRSGWKWE